MASDIQDIPTVEEWPDWSPGARLMALGAAIVVFLFVIGFLPHGLRSTIRWTRLILSGERATATVLDTRRMSTGEGPSTVRLRYQFTTRTGKSVTSWTAESSTEHACYGVGKKVTVLYLPEAAHVNGVENAKWTHLLLGIASMGIGAFAGFLLFQGWRKRRRERRAFRALSGSLVSTVGNVVGFGNHPTIRVNGQPAEVALLEVCDGSGVCRRFRTGVLTSDQRKRLETVRRLSVAYARHAPSVVYLRSGF